ncbi:MAG: hypothetical protein ACD_29C00031G0002 [uncultured bacterium]|nr:MAG: hypothetical protein ACD_29C00031G0002 [uncultured bacterium]
MTIEVILRNNTKKFKTPTQKKFQQWVNTTLVASQKKISKNIIEIGVMIIGKKQSQKLNNIYRKKNKSTNILSFGYNSIPVSAFRSLGDLAICADIVKNEAIKQNKKIESHWAHLTVHGTLHLLGYDHEKNADAKKMELHEIKILKKLGYKNPYAHN